MKPTDNHVHTRWSWDTASTSSMQLACARAVEIGLPGVAFTEHVDFTEWSQEDSVELADVQDSGRRASVPSPGGAVRVDGYRPTWRAAATNSPNCESCRHRGRRAAPISRAAWPQCFRPGTSNACSAACTGSSIEDTLTGIDRALFAELDANELMRRYFAELLVLVGGSSVFNVLAHCDYPRRYWPAARAAFAESDFEEEYRAVFRSLASSERALEINTRSPLASVALMRWWWEEGGEAVSFGSDAHQPYRVGEDFDLAVEVAEAAGFRPGRDRFDFWRR